VIPRIKWIRVINPVHKHCEARELTIIGKQVGIIKFMTILYDDFSNEQFRTMAARLRKVNFFCRNFRYLYLIVVRDAEQA
jgi:hypothetical protein